MKFILLSDLHLVATNPIARLDNLVDVQFEKLEFVFDRAEEFGATILVAGDFFDTPRSWTLLPKVIDLLKKYKTVQVISAFGQHDMYMRSESTESTNLGLLVKNGLVYSSRTIDLGRVSVHLCNFGEKISSYQTEDRERNILVIHAPIGESSVYGVSDFIYAKDIGISESKFDLIHCGDIHQRFLITTEGKTICNPGPLLRIEASEDNFKFSPSFILYDSNTNETSIVEIPHKRSSEVLTREHLEREARVTTMLSQFIENVKSSEVSGVSFQEILFKLLEKEPEEIKEIISEVMSKEDCDV